IPRSWEAMVRRVRNLGWRGICATAISAVDVALWDLKARLLKRPLVQLLGAMRPAVPIYGSGGFTSYSNQRLAEQLAHWVTPDGCQWVKMKVGSEPAQDLQRVRAARSAIGAAGLGCCKPAPSTCCRRTRRVAAASPGFCAPLPSPTRIWCRS